MLKRYFKYRYIKIFLSFISFGIIASPSLVLAIGDQETIRMIPGTPKIENAIMAAVNIILNFAAALAVLIIIVAGIMYIVSAGNEERTKKAKSTLFGAVIGLIIIFFSLIIVRLTNDFSEKLVETANCKITTEDFSGTVHRGTTGHITPSGAGESSALCYRDEDHIKMGTWQGE